MTDESRTHCYPLRLHQFEATVRGRRPQDQPSDDVSSKAVEKKTAMTSIASLVDFGEPATYEIKTKRGWERSQFFKSVFGHSWAAGGPAGGLPHPSRFPLYGDADK
jgi:hypothetical protein